MAASAESLQFEHLSLAGLPMPVILRLAVPLCDQELMAFSRRNRPFRIEQNAKGDLEIMPPLGFEDGRRELLVMCKLGNCAEGWGGLTFSSNVGVVLRDKSV